MSARSTPSRAQSVAPISLEPRGFTLIELLVTISIAVILLTVAAPSFITFLQNNRLSTQTTELVTALQYAKSEAIKRNTIVSVCPVAGATTVCTGGATAWSNGWTVMTDPNNDCVKDTGDEVLRAWPAVDNVSVCFNAGTSVSLLYNGMTSNFGTFRLCDDRGAASANAIILSQQGRTRRATDGADADTIVEVSGTNISCP